MRIVGPTIIFRCTCTLGTQATKDIMLCCQLIWLSLTPVLKYKQCTSKCKGYIKVKCVFKTLDFWRGRTTVPLCASKWLVFAFTVTCTWGTVMRTSWCRGIWPRTPDTVRRPGQGAMGDGTNLVLLPLPIALLVLSASMAKWQGENTPSESRITNN